MLEEIHAQIRACTQCRLHEGRMQAVPGEGPSDAKILFVGEGPGAVEDRYGRPFVGPAGQFLNDLLAGISIQRKETFITNVVKCRPPENRDPLPDEIAACSDYLLAQIAIIRPKVICPLGRFALQTLLDPKLSISRVHGKPFRKQGILYVPLYHPAAALHKETMRQVLIEDFAALKQILAQEQAASFVAGETRLDPEPAAAQPAPTLFDSAGELS